MATLFFRRVMKTVRSKMIDPVFSNKVDVMNLQHVSNKNLSDLKIEPVCNITSKDALSAIRRAKTRSCKQLIANVSCLMRSNKLYPQILPHMCPINGIYSFELYYRKINYS